MKKLTAKKVTINDLKSTILAQKDNQFIGKFKNEKHFIRPPRKKLKEEIDSACDFILNSGENITVREVRRYLNKGSHTTIAKYIKLWRDNKRSASLDNFFRENEDLMKQELQEYEKAKAKINTENEEKIRIEDTALNLELDLEPSKDNAFDFASQFNMEIKNVSEMPLTKGASMENTCSELELDDEIKELKRQAEEFENSLDSTFKTSPYDLLNNQILH